MEAIVEANDRLSVARRNQDLALRLAERLAGCQCAEHESHPGGCLGPWCECH